MGWIISLLVIALPVSEALVIVQVASEIGVFNTIFLLIFTAVVGVYLAKMEGYGVLLKMQNCMQQGQVPTNEMLDGLLIFLAGILFVFPGFISDIMALVLIFPVTRWLIRSLLLKGVRKDQAKRSHQKQSGRFSGQSQDSGFDRSNISEAEIVE